MPVAKTPLPASLPWSVRLFATAPVPPVVSALLCCAAIAVAYLLYCQIAGIPFGEQIVEFQLLQVAMIAFTPAATVYALRGAERDLADLAPVLGPEANGEGAGLERVVWLGRRTLALAGTAGVVFAVGLLFAPGSWTDGRPAIEHPVFLWAAARSCALGWLIARTVTIELGVAFGFARLGARDVEVDWLDQTPLAPFARKGLRSVFLLLVFSFLFSLFLLEPWGKVVAIPILLLFPALCVAALLLPVSGVHRRLVEVKQGEFARVDAALRLAAESNLGATSVASDGARLSNLVAYRGLLDAAGTWPFDLAVWLRFGLYVSLGLGSWLGGALVERLLGAALD